MIRVDLHVHSRYSRQSRQNEERESCTEVETIYRNARQRGARFVTVTDHDAIDGALELMARHPQDCFVSTEATASFPEDGCKVHVLCYGITPAQFAVIQETRENIYALRDYLRAENIACSVAHATVNIDGWLTDAHIEKLLLLFDVFEGINGTLRRVKNIAWQEMLRHLTPAHIAHLADWHRINPWGENSWVKGMTGGSDDHAGLFIGATYTMARVETIPELLNAIRAKRTLPDGRHGDHAECYGFVGKPPTASRVFRKRAAALQLAGDI